MHFIHDVLVYLIIIMIVVGGYGTSSASPKRAKIYTLLFGLGFLGLFVETIWNAFKVLFK